MDYKGMESWDFIYDLLGRSVFNATIFLGGLVIFITFIILLILQSYGYMPSIKKGIRKSSSFIDKYLLIQEANVDIFYNKCIIDMPINVKNAWKSFYSRRDKKASEYLAPELYKRKQVDYKNNLLSIYFKLVCALTAIISAVILLLYGYIIELVAVTLLGYALLYYILYSIYLISRYLMELTYDSTIEDYLSLLNRFVRLKAPLEKLNHYNREPQNAIEYGKKTQTNVLATNTTCVKESSGNHILNKLEKN